MIPTLDGSLSNGSLNNQSLITSFLLGVIIPIITAYLLRYLPSQEKNNYTKFLKVYFTSVKKLFKEIKIHETLIHQIELLGIYIGFAGISLFLISFVPILKLDADKGALFGIFLLYFSFALFSYRFWNYNIICN